MKKGSKSRRSSEPEFGIGEESEEVGGQEELHKIIASQSRVIEALSSAVMALASEVGGEDDEDEDEKEDEDDEDEEEGKG